MSLSVPLVLSSLIALIVGIVASLLTIGIVWIGYKYLRVPKGLNLIAGVFQFIAMAFGLLIGIIMLNSINDFFLGSKSNLTFFCMLFGFAVSCRFIVPRAFKRFSLNNSGGRD